MPDREQSVTPFFRHQDVAMWIQLPTEGKPPGSVTVSGAPESGGFAYLPRNAKPLRKLRSN